MYDHLVILFVAGGRRLELVPVLRNAEIHLRWRGGRSVVRLFGPLFRQKITVVAWNFRFPIVLDPHFDGIDITLQILWHPLLLQNLVEGGLWVHVLACSFPLLVLPIVLLCQPISLWKFLFATDAEPRLNLH